MLVVQVEDYEEEPLLRTGCKEYFWLLCKLIDNIHVKDASQVGTPDCCCCCCCCCDASLSRC